MRKFWRIIFVNFFYLILTYYYILKKNLQSTIILNLKFQFIFVFLKFFNDILLLNFKTKILSVPIWFSVIFGFSWLVLHLPLREIKTRLYICIFLKWCFSLTKIIYSSFSISFKCWTKKLKFKKSSYVKKFIYSNCQYTFLCESFL